MDNGFTGRRPKAGKSMHNTGPNVFRTFALGMSAIVLACGAACSDQSGAPALLPAPVQRPVITAPSRSGKTLYFAAAPQTDGVGFLPLHPRTDANGEGIAGTPSPDPEAWGAGDIEDAYGIPAAGSGSATIAVMAGADDPNIESDLAVYRAQYGLPPCGSSNGCFRKVNGAGQASPLPAAAWNGDPSMTNQLDWAREMTLDVEMASAGCPACKILLIETDIFSNYAAAWASAVRLGATFITNSWFLGESHFTAAAERSAESLFDYTGVSFFSATGDFGYGHDDPATDASTGVGMAWPASSGRVIAVGGTVLSSLPTSPWWSQSAWGGSTAGCSAAIPRPSWQLELYAGACGSFRALADVSALASNVAQYNSWSGEYGLPAGSGWQNTGGTSAASPLATGIFATNEWTSGPSWPYTSPSSFADITTGNDCTPGIPEEMCYAAPGWDFPTGIGTPKGSAAADYFYASPSSVNVAQNTVGSSTLYWGGSWITPDYPTIYAIESSAPSGVLTVTYPDGQGATLQITPSFDTPEQSYAVTVLAEVAQTGVTHSASLTVDVTGCVPAVCPSNSCGTVPAPYTCSRSSSIACGSCATGYVCSENVCCPNGQHWNPTSESCEVTCPAGKAYCPATGACALPSLCGRLGGTRE
jgi:hypothetical protein